jgi:hypothetical protein
MKNFKIGYDKQLEYNYNQSKEFISKFIRNVKAQLNVYSLEIKENALLTSPKELIVQTYKLKHIASLPSFMDESQLLDNFNFDFSYIDSNISRVEQIVKQYGIENGTIKQPDFNVYAENDLQTQMYVELQKVVTALNDLFDNKDKRFTLHLGQIANSFSGVIETDLSNLPHLQINHHALKSIYPN